MSADIETRSAKPASAGLGFSLLSLAVLAAPALSQTVPSRQDRINTFVAGSAPVPWTAYGQSSHQPVGPKPYIAANGNLRESDCAKVNISVRDATNNTPLRPTGRVYVSSLDFDVTLEGPGAQSFFFAYDTIPYATPYEQRPTSRGSYVVCNSGVPGPDVVDVVFSYPRKRFLANYFEPQDVVPGVAFRGSFQLRRESATGTAQGPSFTNLPIALFNMNTQPTMKPPGITVNPVLKP